MRRPRKGPKKSFLEMDDDDDSPFLTKLRNRNFDCSRISVTTGLLFGALLFSLSVILTVIILPTIARKSDAKNIFKTSPPTTPMPQPSLPVPTTPSQTQTPTTAAPTANSLPPSGVDADVLMDVIKNISIVRPPDSLNIKKVRAFLKSCFDPHVWKVEEDTFTAEVPPPLGNKQFSNIIATLNPNAPKRIILSAHYDSKWFPEPNEFEGATDSAAPCGIMCYIARNHFRLPTHYTNITLQMVFFDGEEAYVSWSEHDSLYGARHLAEKWDKEKSLKSIEALVLLDLLGSIDTSVQPLSQRTKHFYEKILDIQAGLIIANMTRKKKYFLSFPAYSISEDPYSVQDDHIPFLRKGVPVVHLISLPFPKVWHTVKDNFSAIDKSTVHDLAAILWRFLKDVLV